MVALIHQNMRNFGGGTAARNAEYETLFRQISQQSVEPFSVIGFTEITNNQTSLAAMTNFCAAVGTNFCACINIGTMAVSAKSEFIGIGTSRPLSFGRVLVHASGQSAELFVDVCPQGQFDQWCAELPSSATADYRGVAYVVVPMNQVNIAVLFLHNIYAVTEGRSVLLQKIAHCADLIREHDPMQPTLVYAGGDFNARPVDRKSRSGTLMRALTQPSLQYSPPPPPLPQEMLSQNQSQMPGNRPGGTLLSGNLYDYWYFGEFPNEPVPAGFRNPPNAGLDTRTCQVGSSGAVPGTNGYASDHMASFLLI